MNDIQREWREAGIVDESEFVRLVYNEPAGVLAVQFRREAATGAPVASLYMRKREALRYARLSEPSENLSYENPVSAPLVPVLIANVLEWDDQGNADWKGVIRFELEAGRTTMMITEDDLELPQPYVRGWVTSIHSAWEDGRGVICTIGFERPTTQVESDRYFEDSGLRQVLIVDHWLCKLDLGQKRNERLSQLAAGCF